MPAKTKDININLLPEDPFFQTINGRVLRWILSVGRYLVIFTELVVIVSFATRFTLDRKITDLNRTIFQKMSVIDSYGDFEQRFVLIQNKLDQYEELTKQQNLTDTFALLSSITPADVSVEKLSITKDRVVVSGQSLTQAAFNNLINNLQLSPNFANVSVGKITVNPEGTGYIFQFQASTTK
jgi:Tfp pilus assembly protein PilN